MMFNMQMLQRSEPQNLMVVAAIASAGKLERALLTLSRQNALGRCTHLAVLDACYQGSIPCLLCAGMQLWSSPFITAGI